MLLGTCNAKFAPGHRVAVPAIFRKDLGEKFIIARWYEDCLVLVAKETWNALLKRIIGTEQMIVTPVRNSEHFLYTSAFEVTPDDQGRIVIPEKLVLFANLGEEICFLGIGDRAEIWDKNIWDLKEKEVQRDAPKYIEELANKNAK